MELSDNDKQYLETLKEQGRVRTSSSMGGERHYLLTMRDHSVLRVNDALLPTALTQIRARENELLKNDGGISNNERM